MAAELGRDKGSLKVAFNLRSGPAAGKTWLLHLLGVPTDEVGERDR